MCKNTHTCKLVTDGVGLFHSVSSSTAASGSKHPREEEGDVEGPTHAKRQRLDEEGEGK